MVFFSSAGRLSYRIGRKKPIVWGYVVTLLLLFPCFWWMGSVANPALEAAAERAPVVVTGSKCSFDPFAKAQATACGKTLGELTRLGVTYRVGRKSGVEGKSVSVRVELGGRSIIKKKKV